MKEIKGNLIKLAKEGEFDLIIHGCNCFCKMGNGIALDIKKEFPEAYQVDQETYPGDKTKLGSYTSAISDIPSGELIIVNAYTQYTYKRNESAKDPKMANKRYNAITQCMKKIKQDFSGKKIGMPMIGAGLAGGDWKIIKDIIQKELEGVDVTIVYL